MAFLQFYSLSLWFPQLLNVASLFPSLHCFLLDRQKEVLKSSDPAFVIIQFWHHKTHILALDFGMVVAWTRSAAELWLKCNLHLGEASAGFLVSGKTFLTTLHAALATLSHTVSTS